ncbi:MAG: hypothetical protein HY855_06710 [Burkholderiales bacterium]|nr:hypothetical protein [Burkholderiales bacterium]
MLVHRVQRARRPALAAPHLSALASPLLALMLAATAAAPALAQTASAAAPASAAASAPAGPTLRPEVAKPLIAAQDLLKTSKEPAAAKEALARVAEAEAVPNLTPFEAYNATRIKAVAAVTAGDMKLALTSFEQALASPHLPAGDKLAITDFAARIALQSGDMARGAALLRSYKDLGGADLVLRRRYAALLLEQNDHAGALAEAQALTQADQAAGRVPPELLLKVMAISHSKLGNQAGYMEVLEQLTLHYTTPEYWSDLTSRVARKPGFSDERLRLDMYRLQRTVGIVLEADELADMAQRAQLAGLPAEAQKLMDEGYASGLFGKGAQAAAHQKLREQATKAAALDQKSLAEGETAARTAKDGNALVNLGMAVAGAGANERALGLMEQGIAKGGLRRPDEALLHLGLVQVRLGRTQDALKTFAEVKGSDGTADLARLWSLHLRSNPKK